MNTIIIMTAVETQTMSRSHKEDLESSFSQALSEACKSTDLKTLDWFSYNPDFYAEKEKNVA